MELLFILVWLGLCFLVGKSADNKGRSFGGWLFLALMISPLFAGFGLLLCKDLKGGVDKYAK